MSILVYVFLFISLFIQVFLIITLFEFYDKRKQQKKEPRTVMRPDQYPSITIIVPCFNEENTVIKTVESLLALNYPENKLDIIAIDDGSRDGTWAKLQSFKDHSRIKIFTKENGGKHTTMNLGISQSKSDIIGCLDADSFVHREALVRMVPYFLDQEVMAVTPAIKVRSPKTILEFIQYAEYNVGIYLRKMYSSFNAIHVTPGPLSLFRRNIFAKIGMFRNAYNTEDLELALRMHSHNMKIENAHNAYVFTTPPQSIRDLVKQRVRWTTGFLLNAKDYRHLMFSKNHGHIGTFTLPAAVLSIVIVLFFTAYSIFSTANSTVHNVVQWWLAGFSWKFGTFQWFFVNTTSLRILTVILLVTTVAVVFAGKRISSGSWKLSKDMIYYMLLYGFLAPIWISISGYRAITRQVGSWR